MSTILRTGRICPVMLTMCGTIMSRVRGVIGVGVELHDLVVGLGSIGSETRVATMPWRLPWSANMSSIAP